MRRSVDVVLKRVPTQHVRIVNLHRFATKRQLILPQKPGTSTHEDTPQVDEGEESDKHVLVDREEVAAEMVGDRLQVAVDRVERMRSEGRGDCEKCNRTLGPALSCIVHPRKQSQTY
jgi:hypothetical protein